MVGWFSFPPCFEEAVGPCDSIDKKESLCGHAATSHYGVEHAASLLQTSHDLDGTTFPFVSYVLITKDTHFTCLIL